MTTLRERQEAAAGVCNREESKPHPSSRLVDVEATWRSRGELEERRGDWANRRRQQLDHPHPSRT